MITKATVDLLKSAWSQGVQEILDGEIRITQEALVAASTERDIYALQGKARALKAMQKFPAYIEHFIESKGDSHGELDQRGD